MDFDSYLAVVLLNKADVCEVCSTSRFLTLNYCYYFPAASNVLGLDC